jgi:hypothetical protein
MEHYKLGKVMKAVDEVVNDAKDWRRANPDAQSRPDAWR